MTNRTNAWGIKFRWGGMACYGKVAITDPPDILPIRVFLQVGKAGSGIEAMARDAAVFASLALEYGCPLDRLKDSVTRLDDGTAAGPAGEFLDRMARARDAADG